MWRGTTYGQGRIYPDGTELQTILDDLGVLPDCITAEGIPYTFIHRILSGADVYFVSNQSNQPQTFDALFRVSGKAPDTLDPVTGERRQLSQYSQTDEGQTLVPLRLEPLQSLFVVFDSKRSAKDGSENYPEPQVLATVDAPWTVTFQAGRRGPAEPLIFQQLSDWSQSQDEAIKYFSGSATYEYVLNVDELPAGPLYLDLGRVMVMARVWVNGKYAGGVWTSPYRVPVGGLLKRGQNQVRIEVVNNWRNRLIGDARLPEAERQTYATVNPYKAESELQASGLMGPVQLVK
jgi:hypothetical protein